MPIFRLCKRFTVESGHMLSKHAERCRFPHGHTRTIEVVVASHQLNSADMVVDFKALKHALKAYINRFDHSMAINSKDPLLDSIQATHPDSLIIFENTDPTTEVLAQNIFKYADDVLKNGWSTTDGAYAIPAGQIWLERVRVWETPDSWAEVGLS